jgi:xylulokinase
MEALIGVDIGTQGTKAALFAEDGRLLGTAFQKSVLHQPRPGVVEEDPERQLASVCRTIKQCVTAARLAPDHVAAIAIDGQMAGILGVGQDGRHVTPYDSWLDTRCAPYISKMNKVASDEILAKTGGPASFNHGPKILWWMRERPKVFRSIRSFVQPGGYAAMRLCGLTARQAYVDKTYLHFSGFANTRKACWDEDLCRTFGLDPEKLPRIVEPHAVVGEMTGAMARRCGLRAGVPVAAGCGDTAASFLACGATREGICVDVAGTASVLAATTSLFRADRRHKVLSCGHAATPGLWHPYAYINGGGMNLEWFRQCVMTPGQTVSGNLEFADLDRLTRSIPLTEDLPLFVPHLGGRVSPSWPDLRGAWVGLSWSHTAAHLWRALLEGVALEYAIYKKLLLQLHPHLKLTEMRVTGGGERSALWNQIKAEALALKLVQIHGSEGAPVGAAMLAGFAVGLIKNLNTAQRQWIETGTVTRPKRRLRCYYQKRLDRYERILEALNQWSQQ